jgi:serine protease Do
MSFYEKARRQKLLSSMLILFTLALGVLIGTVLQTGAKAAKEQVVATDATPLTIPNPVVLQNSFSKVAKMLEPSVVNISTEYIPKQNTESKNGLRRRQPQQQQQQPQSPDDDDNSMQEFFQRFFGGGAGPMLEAPDQPTASLGSGVVVDKNGYILTNNHVVEKATRIRVKFANDDNEYPANVIGTDKDTDLAVIKVEKKNVIPARVGNSDALQVGDWAIAIGSPFGFRATVTAGIISALSRGQEDIRDPEVSSFQHFIQTDAAINPGNSGGPLANINGEVIGINTMIASRSGGNQGIGFAMPINTAVKVYNAIIKSGHVTRGSIGIRFRENPDQQQQTDLLRVYGANHGVFVEQVEPDGPADKGGVKPEDVITSINGKPVMRGQDLIDVVADSPIGQPLQVGVVRDKKPMTLNVTVGDRTKIFADQYGGAKQAPSPNGESTQMKFGMSIQPLTTGLRQQMNLHTNGGVLIAAVETGSFADDIGLAKGDVVIEMNRQPITSPSDVQRIQGTLKPGDPVAFKVMRQAQAGPRGQGEWQPTYLAGTVPANQ